MKRIYLFVTFFLLLTACQNRELSQGNACLKYIDSLKIKLDDKTINVAVVNLKQDFYVRPYSIIFDNHLLALNFKDYFYAFDLNCFKRDPDYENQINTHMFQKSFVASDTLFGIDSVNQVFYFDRHKTRWNKYSAKLPFNNSMPVFENEKYKCYSDDRGEFGGTLYFINKKDGRITYLPYVWAISIIEDKEGYFVVSSLPHEHGWCEIINVDNPDSLDEFPKHATDYDINLALYSSWEDSPTSNRLVKEIYSKSGEIFLSGFKFNGNNYYLSKYLIKTESDLMNIYLTKIENNKLRIIPAKDSLFSGFWVMGLSRKTRNLTILDWNGNLDTRKTIDNDDSPPPFKEGLIKSFILKDSVLVKINWDIKNSQGE